ncbi:MAG: TonB-dependent receptor, partial [Dialister sp.]|nr:TonB-dependent receptor [Dialister sp.]
WKYFLSANRNMAGDIKYHDGITGEDHIYTGTSYKEEGVSFRLDKEFDNGQNLKIWYGHQNGKDHYPITARDWRYWSEADWNRIIERTTREGGYGNTDNPGYRNLFSLDALSGSYNAYRNNDLDISYTFGKDNGMESFVRAYRQKHHYWGVDRYPDWIDEKDGSYVPFPDSPAWENFIKNYKFPNGYNPTSTYVEDNKGIQLQYGKSIGNHDVLTAVTFDKAYMEKNKYNRKDKTWTKTTVERKSIFGFVQDKIHVSDKWDITPSIRYSHYSDYTGGVYNNKGNGTIVTPSLATQYAFDDTFSGYIGWTKVYRPIKAKDYTLETPNGQPLEDEKGNVWTIGLNKRLSENTTIGVHYNLIDMSNAITYYNVRKHGEKDLKNKAVNAKEKKKAFNVTLDHKFNNNWNLSLAYTRLDDKYTAKKGMDFDPDLGLGKSSNPNSQINKLRAANHYIANLSYEKDKWYTGLLVNWYTGCNTEAYTHRRALVLDWNLNYEVNDSLSTYLTVTNLTNQAYENAYSAYNGLGAAPQPGRAWMIGAKYKF